MNPIYNCGTSSDFWVIAAFAQASGKLIFGQLAPCLETRDRAQTEHPDVHSEAATVLLARANAELLIAIGQSHRPVQSLRAADTNAQPVLAVPLAWIHVLSGGSAAARQIATRALFNKATTVPGHIGLLLAFAVAEVRLGHTPAARDAPEQAIAAATDSGVIRPFVLIQKTAVQSLQAAVKIKFPEDLRRRLLVSRGPTRRPSLWSS